MTGDEKKASKGFPAGVRRGARCAAALLSFIIMLIAVPVGLRAQSPSPVPMRSGQDAEKPINIASDRMVADQKSRTVIFEGHVTVQQGAMTITGQKLTVYGAERAKGAGNPQGEVTGDQIERIEVEGNVVISEGDRVATSQKAVLYNKEQKIVLMGSPVLVQGKDRVQGDLITLYLEDQRSVVEGRAGSPVQAVFHPKETPKKP
ncbi:MAG: lipopolysaccharide transport periplasmic protein LptA [Desulfosoma sp.]